MTRRLAERQGSNPGSIPGESIVHPNYSTLNRGEEATARLVAHWSFVLKAAGAAEDHSNGTSTAIERGGN